MQFKIQSFLGYFLIFGQFVSICSIASSSFIEEEHQIWYYMCNALFIMFICCDLRAETRLIPLRFVLKLAFLIMHIVIRRINKTGDKWMHIPDLSDWLQDDYNDLWIQLVIICSVALSLMYLMIFHFTKRSVVNVLIAIIIIYLFQSRQLDER